MSNNARRSKRLFAGFLAAVLALTVAPIIGLASPAGAAPPPPVDPIGAGNFCEDTGTTEPFTDVSDDDPAQAHIACLVATQITTGKTATTYEPNSFVTRRQMALFLVRTAAEADRLEIADNIMELPAPAANTFTDVADESQSVRDAISQLDQAGVANGFPDNTYRPEAPVSRRQMAAFIDRLYGYLTGAELPRATEDYFQDDDADSAEAQSSTNAVAQAGIFTGNTDGTFRPAQEITRRQMAFVLTRTLQVLFENGEITKWSAQEAPGTNQSFSVTPQDTATLVFEEDNDTPTAADDREYTVSGLVAGATYCTELFDADNVTVGQDGVVTFQEGTDTTTADPGTVQADITVVNGAAQADDTTRVCDAAEADGTVTFTVDGEAAENVIPVTYEDTDSDGFLDIDENGEPTEPFGIGGETVFVADTAVVTAAVLEQDEPLIGAADAGDVWTITFDEDIDTATLEGAQIALTDADGDTILVECSDTPQTPDDEFLTAATCTLGDGDGEGELTTNELTVTLSEDAEDRNAAGDGVIEYPLTIDAIDGLMAADGNEVEVSGDATIG